jgi:hypothetical protein
VLSATFLLIGFSGGKKKYVDSGDISWKSTWTSGDQRRNSGIRARVSGWLCHAQSRFRSKR